MGVAEQILEQLRTAHGPPLVTTDLAADLFDVVGSEVGQATKLEVIPDRVRAGSVP